MVDCIAPQEMRIWESCVCGGGGKVGGGEVGVEGEK